MVKILDCTTRDGGHLTNWNFDRRFVLELIETLNRCGVSFFEIGYRNFFDNENKGEFYNCDENLLEKYKNYKKDLDIGVMVDVRRYNLKSFDYPKDKRPDFVRIATHPQDIEKAIEIAEELHNKSYKIFIQLMNISDVGEVEYKQLGKWRKKEIIESLYIADSKGVIQPSQIRIYFEKLKSIGFERISFHGHNANKKALENSLEAIRCGAYSVDTTKNGQGRFGGNLSLDELLKNL